MFSARQDVLPLSVMRHGMAFILTGLIIGFIIPQTPFPRLAMSAHLQFEVEGAMILLIGLLLNSKPFPRTDIRLASTLSSLQANLVLWGCIACWPVLLSEVANSWWGTKGALPILHAAGVSSTWTAKQWQEVVVSGTHFGGAPFMVAGFGVILYSLFQTPAKLAAVKAE